MSSEHLKCLIDQRDLNGIREFLSNGGNVNQLLPCYTTPLFYAIQYDAEEEMFTFEDDCDGENFTYRDDEIVLQLIKAGADVYARDHQHRTPLMYALYLRRGYKVVGELINAGSDINVKCCHKYTPLMCAIRSNYRITLIEKLLRMGASVHDRDWNLWSPLYYAVNHINSFEIVSLLIKYGADVSVSSKDFPNVFANVSCGSCTEDYCESKRMINLILDNGLKLKKEAGCSVIHGTNCNYLIRLYIQKGVSVDSRDSNNWTPLINAVNFEYERKVESLLFLFNADPNCLDNHSRTALHYNCSMSHAGKVNTWILYHGGNLYARDINNRTSLDVLMDRNNWLEPDSSLSSVLPIIKYIILFVDENGLKDSFRHYRSEDKVFLQSFIKDCKKELSEMKATVMTNNLTFYEFCLLKKYYKSEFIDISVDEYFYDFKQIKSLFPIYHDMIITRMKDNQAEYYKRVLNSRLECVIIRSLRVVENETDKNVQLIYDCTVLMAQHLNKKGVYNLFLASCND